MAGGAWIGLSLRMGGRRSTGTEMSVSVRVKVRREDHGNHGKHGKSDRSPVSGRAGGRLEDRQIASGSSWSTPGHRVCVDHDDRCLAVCRAVRNIVLDTVRYSPQCTRSVHNTNSSLSRVVEGMTCAPWDSQAFCQCRTNSRHPYYGERSSVCLPSHGRRGDTVPWSKTVLYAPSWPSRRSNGSYAVRWSFQSMARRCVHCESAELAELAKY